MSNAHAHCLTCIEYAAEIIADYDDDDTNAPQSVDEYLDMIVRNQQHTLTTNVNTCSYLHADWY